MRKDELVGRFLGIMVFLGGIVLLGVVFLNAYSWFTTPNAGLSVPTGTSSAGTTSQLGQSAIRMLVKIGLLIVMTIVGSLLAGRGIQLYLASLQHHRPPAMAPKDDPA